MNGFDFDVVCNLWLEERSIYACMDMNMYMYMQM